MTDRPYCALAPLPGRVPFFCLVIRGFALLTPGHFPLPFQGSSGGKSQEPARNHAPEARQTIAPGERCEPGDIVTKKKGITRRNRVRQ